MAQYQLHQFTLPRIRGGIVSQEGIVPEEGNLGALGELGVLDVLTELIGDITMPRNSIASRGRLG